MWFQKISILPPQKGLEILGRRGGGGVLKCQKFKAMYEAKLEFLEGWGGHRANPFRWGYGYFLEPHIISINTWSRRDIQWLNEMAKNSK